jgi:hypothetical protein
MNPRKKFNKSLDLTLVKDTATMTYYHTDEQLRVIMGERALTDLKHFTKTAYVSYNRITNDVMFYVDGKLVNNGHFVDGMRSVSKWHFIRVIGDLCLSINP